MLGPFHFLNIAYGEKHVRLWLDYALPNQLAPENLPLFAPVPRCVYRVYTTNSDVQRITSSPSYRRLNECLRVELHAIDHLIQKVRADGLDKYALMNLCHLHAIQIANQESATLIFLHPDCFFSNNSFKFVLRQAIEGKRVVLSPGINLNIHTFLPAMTAAAKAAGERPLAPSSRLLLKVALEHFHTHTQTRFWDSPRINVYPTNLYWRIGSEGFLARCFHIHPVMIRPKNMAAIAQRSFDDDYLHAACPDLEDHAFAQDSDDLLVCSLNETGANIDTEYAGRYSTDSMAFFALFNRLNDQHLAFFRRPYRFHVGEMSGEWSEVEQQTGGLAEEILNKIATLKTNSEVMAWEDWRAMYLIKYVRRIADAYISDSLVDGL